MLIKSNVTVPIHLINFLVKTGCGRGLLGLRVLVWSGEPGKGSRRPLRFGALVNLAGPLSPFFFCKEGKQDKGVLT